jgi:Protein of unknown function (DUF3631)
MMSEDRLRILRERYEGDRPVEIPETVPRIAILLQQVAGLLRQYVVFANDYQVTATALWVPHTHAIAAADSTPYLAVTSAEKRSGKTRLCDVLELLVANPWRAVTPSEAVTFRKIHKDHPTLLLDEADAIWGKDSEHEGLRALLNAGHRRGVKVPRMVGDGAGLKVAEFEVFGPKVIAGIGGLPDTVMDRSIPIRLHRRASHEHVERFRFKEAAAFAEPIRLRLEAWASEMTADLREARPALPNIDDRAGDGWEPLLAIADTAGGDWPRRAREAAVWLHAEDPLRSETFGVRLLQDIHDVFAAALSDRIPSAELALALAEIEEAPWGNLKGHSLDARGLAWRLRPFEVFPKDIRVIRPDGERVVKGYAVEQFAEAWGRYLDDPDPRSASQSDSERYTATPQVDGPISPFEAEPPKSPNMAPEQACSAVADENHEPGATETGVEP